MVRTFKFAVMAVLGVALVFGALPQSARADLTGLSIRFAGGCVADNTGSCTITATASDGASAAGELVRLKVGADKNHLALYSTRARALGASGTTSFRFPNQKACYQVVSKAATHGKPDVRSNVRCE